MADRFDFESRAKELDALHRKRDSFLRALAGGPSSSWLYRWARGLISLPFPARVGPPPSIPLPGPGECAISFLGHATTLIRYTRGRILTDPCFARSLYTLRRARPPALPPGALEGLDVVLLSHGHTDHLHRPSLERIDRSVTLVVPAGEGAADKMGFQRVVELEPDESLEAGDLTITAVAVQHKVGVFGRRRALGYVVRGNGPTLFFAGDTAYYPGFHDVGERFRPEVALLPISGYRPRALRADHLSPLDAIYALEDLGAHLLVPIHHSSFALGYEPLGEPLTWLRSLEGARGLRGRIAWLDPGESCVARRAAPAPSPSGPRAEPAPARDRQESA